MEQQLLQTQKTSQVIAKQIARILAQKTDIELKNEFPIFWELLKIKIQTRMEL
ncbi:hypothetical protein KKE06_02565 [Candidatus Micrarchaeota archaeon]|nr:hypothetical protein [Candidatus Micrarchaeota archaeon]MBU1929899.1 hypothetical protein [Candidatus Micrarchaeota archaeon]